MRASRELKQAARAMRVAPTNAEALLWEAVRDRRVEGMKFRRQYQIDRFVIDFYCASHRLAVEVDGSSHDRQVERDEARTELLAARGIRVIRFRNEEVLVGLHEVIARIRSYAHDRVPPLPLAGEGARG